jgi:MraZ protein
MQKSILARSGQRWPLVDSTHKTQLIPGMPLGMYTTRVDDKGRIKLPVDFQECFAKAGYAQFFITSLDRVVGRLYPITLWRENLDFFANYLDDPESSEDVMFNADDLGGEAAIDGQGRVMLNAELRTELGLENQVIRLRGAGAYVELLSEAVYLKRKERAAASGSEAVSRLRRAGLK